MKQLTILLAAIISLSSCSSDPNNKNNQPHSAPTITNKNINSLLIEGIKGDVKEIVLKAYSYDQDGVGIDKQQYTNIRKYDRKGRLNSDITLTPQGETTREYLLIDSNSNTTKQVYAINKKPLTIEEVTFKGQKILKKLSMLKDGDTILILDVTQTYYPKENYKLVSISKKHPQNTLDTLIVETINTSDTSHIRIYKSNNTIDSNHVTNLSYDSLGNPTKSMIKYADSKNRVYNIITYTYYNNNTIDQ